MTRRKTIAGVPVEQMGMVRIGKHAKQHTDLRRTLTPGQASRQLGVTEAATSYAPGVSGVAVTQLRADHDLLYTRFWQTIDLIKGKGYIFAGIHKSGIRGLAPGANGSVLVTDSTQTLGLRWDTVSAVVGAGNLTMANGTYIATDEVRARDSGGLLLRDDAGTLGIFIEDSTGDVGIGTSSPTAPLHLDAGSTSTGAILEGQSAASNINYEYRNTASVDVANSVVLGFGVNSTTQLRSPSQIVTGLSVTTDATRTGYILFGTPSAGTFSNNRLVIDGDKVGIGNGSPQASLHVGAGADATVTTAGNILIYATRAGTSALVLRDETNDIEMVMIAANPVAIFGTATNNDVRIRANNADRMTIEAGGDVGIGTTNPAGKLHVVGTILVDGDGGGVAGTTGFTDINDLSANSTGVGTILFKGTTNRNSTGFIKIYVGTTAYYVPVFAAITG